jgi:Tat protein secretion system quality control protein TatD with DNase activity
MKLFDSHCHLTDPPLSRDLDGILCRAQVAGVSRFMVPGYDLASSRSACRLAKSHPAIKAAVGLHPGWINSAGMKKGFSPESFRLLARLRAPVAIGEIGLDYALDNYSVDVQAKVLQAQLELAALLALPVIIHCRRAFEPLYLILREFPGVTGVIHAYGGGPQMVGDNIGDSVPGVWTALGIMMALEKRHRTGEGAFVDMSMYDCMAAHTTSTMPFYQATGIPAGRERGNMLSAQLALRAKDGWVVLAGAGGPEKWKDLWRLMDREDLIEDERYLGVGVSGDFYLNGFVPALEGWTMERTKAEVTSQLIEIGSAVTRQAPG